MTEFHFTDLEELPRQAEELEARTADSTLELYPPAADERAWYDDLCRFYARANGSGRFSARQAVTGKNGILNRLLGLVYDSVVKFNTTGDASHLYNGLAAAAIRGDGPDFRDFYLALAELWMALEKAGLDPKREFEAMGGGIPLGFESFAVLKARRGRPGTP